MKRIYIEGFADGNLAVDTQSLISNRKITGDKRKRGEVPEHWQRIERTIVRPGKDVPEKVAELFNSAHDLDIAAQAVKNSNVARKGYRAAVAAVTAANKFEREFSMQPPNERRITIEERVPLGAGMWEWREVTSCPK